MLRGNVRDSGLVRTGANLTFSISRIRQKLGRIRHKFRHFPVIDRGIPTLKRAQVKCLLEDCQSYLVDPMEKIFAPRKNHGYAAFVRSSQVRDSEQLAIDRVMSMFVASCRQ